MQIFDFVKSISSSKENLLNSETRSIYSSFVINRAFSQFPDTIFYAETANRNADMSPEMHYAYMMGSVSKRNRFQKWAKPEYDPSVEHLMELYGYSRKRAMEAAELLTVEQKNYLEECCYKGGKK